MEDKEIIESRLKGYKLLKTALNAIDEYNKETSPLTVPGKAHLVLGYRNTGHIARVTHEELDKQIQTLSMVSKKAEKVE